MITKNITTKPKVLTVRLRPTLRRKVERIAREDRRSLAGVIEIAVIKFLEERTA